MSQHSCLRTMIHLIPAIILMALTVSCHKPLPSAVVTPVSVKSSGPKPARAVPQRVSFPSRDHDNPVTINGLFFKPNTAATVRLPAVVALHGCGGMYSSAKSRKNSLSERHQAMADLLVAEGYAVLFPDSFRSRGFEEVCTIRNRDRTVAPKQRRLDAQGALEWLQGRNDIQAQRIAILGWSHGGSTVLATLNAKQPAVAEWTGQAAAAPYFRAGVAFYPGCRESLNSNNGYSLAAPLTLFIGAEDDWTAPEPCMELADNLAKKGENVSITVYPDAHHGFDGPSIQPVRRLEVPNGVNPGRGVTMAANPAAREDAYAKMKEFLRRHLMQ